MSGGDSLTCPECGKTVKSERRLHKTRRRRAWALLAVIGGGGAVALALTPQVQGHGWSSLVPNRLLIEAAAYDPYTSSQLARALAARSGSFTPADWQRFEEVLLQRIRRSRNVETWTIVSSIIAHPPLQRRFPMLGNEFISGFRDKNPELRIAAVFGAALCLPPEDTALNPFLNALDDDQPYVRIYATWAFLRYDTDTEPMSGARPRLRQVAEDVTEVEQARAYALSAIMPWDDYDHTLTPVVLDLLQSNQWVIRSTALLRLRGLRTLDPDITAQLRTMLTDVQLRGQVAWRLAQMGDRDSIDAIINLLDDPDWTVRRDAAGALGEFGPDAKAALPRLQDMLESDPSKSDPDAHTMILDAAALAIDRINASPAPDP